MDWEIETGAHTGSIVTGIALLALLGTSGGVIYGRTLVGFESMLAHGICMTIAHSFFLWSSQDAYY